MATPDPDKVTVSPILPYFEKPLKKITIRAALNEYRIFASLKFGVFHKAFGINL
jgi:hypothetical protein